MNREFEAREGEKPRNNSFSSTGMSMQYSSYRGWFASTSNGPADRARAEVRFSRIFKYWRLSSWVTTGGWMSIREVVVPREKGAS